MPLIAQEDVGAALRQAREGGDGEEGAAIVDDQRVDVLDGDAMLPILPGDDEPAVLCRYSFSGVNGNCSERLPPPPISPPRFPSIETAYFFMMSPCAIATQMSSGAVGALK